MNVASIGYATAYNREKGMHLYVDNRTTDRINQQGITWHGLNVGKSSGRSEESDGYRAPLLAMRNDRYRREAVILRGGDGLLRLLSW